MVAVAKHEIPALFRAGHQHTGIMLLHETGSFRRIFADDDALRPLQHHAEQGAQPRRPRPDDQYRIPLRYLRNTGSPESGSEQVSHEQGLFVAHRIGNTVQTPVGIRDPDILRLTAVDTASQRPAPLRVGAIVHIAAAAEETLAAKGLDVHRHPVADLHRGNLRPHLLHHSHHLVSDGDARHRTGHAAVLDMQVARTNTAQRHAYDRIARPRQFRYRLIRQSEFPVFDISVCPHGEKSFRQI